MLQSLLLVFSLCLDTFVASIAYGTDKIKIPFYSSIIINLVCSSFLGIALFLGDLLNNFIFSFFSLLFHYMPINVATYLSFFLLLGLGIYRVFEVFCKKYIKKFSNKDKPLTFKVFDFKFVLQIYADEIKADYDNSKLLSAKEAFYLAIALSLDSLAVGFGSGLGYVNYAQVIILCFLVGIVCLRVGSQLGRHFANIMNVNLSWLSGVLLIILAFIRTF